MTLAIVMFLLGAYFVPRKYKTESSGQGLPEQQRHKKKIQGLRQTVAEEQFASGISWGAS